MLNKIVLFLSVPMLMFASVTVDNIRSWAECEMKIVQSNIKYTHFIDPDNEQSEYMHFLFGQESILLDLLTIIDGEIVQ